MVGVGQDLQRLSGPTPLPKAGAPTAGCPEPNPVGFCNVSEYGGSAVVEMRKSLAN